MKRESTGPIHTTVFVDYDNIYLSLKRKNEEAAKRFAKDSGVWLQGIVSGELITPTTPWGAPVERRLAMTRCYGNSTPRRNSHDNSTDMNSFPFVKHHFLRAGFEIVDCLPMTQQLKNAADIRMVLEIGDILSHNTFFDEVVILSGDADFTPLLHRLRAHARRSVVFANENTAQPYTALSDGEIREASLISLLINGSALQGRPPTREIAAPQTEALPAIDIEAARKAILTEVVGYVRGAPQAVPLETLADRAVRVVGRERTIGSDWGGFGSFHKLLLSGLPNDLHLSDTPPYTVFDENRHISENGLVAPQITHAPAPAAELAPPREQAPLQAAPYQQPQAFAPSPVYTPVEQAAISAPQHAPSRRAPDPTFQPQQSPTAAQQRPFTAPAPQQSPYAEQRREAPRQQQPAAALPPAPQQRSADQATQIQQSIARIHGASNAPALAPAEYRVLFDVLAREITEHGLQGAQTLTNLIQRAREFGLDLKRDDLRFILEVVSESDPWFEQGASASLFASRFRNFVVARCRSSGLNLSADELDLVEAWFSAQPPQQRAPAYGRTTPPPATGAPATGANPQGGQQGGPQAQAGAPAQGERWWSLEEGRRHIAEQGGYAAEPAAPDDEFPRIVRTRLRG